MNIPLNCTPDLSMIEITQKLFNSKFLSDIQFRVADQVIYAHSLELMKRSIVFQHQLEATLGDSKLIPIENISFKCFYQFIRFIYTDRCELNGEIAFDVLKLAIKYKIPKLENFVMEFLNIDNKHTIRLFNMCVTEKLQLPLGRVIETLAHDMSTYLSNNDFLSIHPNAIEQILNFDRINVHESQLFRALNQWIDHQMDQNQVPLKEGRARFIKYIQLIRFSSMSVDDVLEGLSKKYRWLTENDFTLIFKQTADERPVGVHSTKCPGRLNYSYPYEWLKIPTTQISSTTFRTTKELLLIGVRYGNDAPQTNHLIQLKSMDLTPKTISKLNFKYPTVLSEKGSRIFSFGHAMQLQPNTDYSLNILYLGKLPTSLVLCRAPNRDTIVRAPRNTVHLIKSGLNIIELHFKSVAEHEDLINL